MPGEGQGLWAWQPLVDRQSRIHGGRAVMHYGATRRRSAILATRVSPKHMTK